MAMLDDAIDAQRQQYPFFLPETDRPPAPSESTLEIPQALSSGIRPPLLDPRSERAALTAALLSSLLPNLFPAADISAPGTPTTPLGTTPPTTIFPTMQPGDPYRTRPLRSVEARGEMYHGAPRALEEMSQTPQGAEGMGGPGFYTASRWMESRAYTGPRGYMYGVNQPGDVPLFDASRGRIPRDVLEAVHRRFPHFDVDRNANIPGIHVYQKYWRQGGPNPEGEAIKTMLSEELSKKGWRGLRYLGYSDPDDPFIVKLYWHPEDYRAREINPSFGSYPARARAPVPTIEPPPPSGGGPVRLPEGYEPSEPLGTGYLPSGGGTGPLMYKPEFE